MSAPTKKNVEINRVRIKTLPHMKKKIKAGKKKGNEKAQHPEKFTAVPHVAYLPSNRLQPSRYPDY
jgi:hypothetical protein